MKIFVINLDKRKDRMDYMSKQLQGYEWERFPAVNGYNLTLEDISAEGFYPFVEWRDPMRHRPHTMTDLAAMMSHFKVWEKCVEVNEPIIVLEDDAEKMQEIDFTEIKSMLETYDLVFLDQKEMFPDHSGHHSDKFFFPYYPYLTTAYALTPAIAKKFISSAYKKNLFSVDEFFSCVNGVNYNNTCLSTDIKIKNQFLKLQSILSDVTMTSIAYRDKVFKQVSRNILGSDIENGALLKMEPAKKVAVFTVGTEEERLHLLYKTGNKFNIKITNLGAGVEWKGGDSNKAGCGHKLNLVKTAIKDIEDDTIVLFVDGYDVIFNDNLDTIVNRFLEFDLDALFGAEKVCWPDPSLTTFFDSHTEYKHLNSGLYISYVKALKEILSGDIKDEEDDQLYLQRYYIAHKAGAVGKNLSIDLDKECYIFQNHGEAHEDVVLLNNGQLRNTATRCRPCILHGNGGSHHKERFFKFIQPLVRDLKYTPKIINYIKEDSAQVVSSDILEMKFLSPQMCRKFIELAEKSNKWESMYGDKFPGQEIRIREISIPLFEELENQFMDICKPIVEKYWFPTMLYGLRDAFIIKYSPESQKSLNCHNDASMVSGMIKLNEDYTGGDTYFYRQKFSNINTKQGNIILWPSQVTHGHEGREVTSGTKYNLVIWTRRMKNDINY